MKSFDRVVLSSNEDPKYLDFWPIVSNVWRKLFDVEVSLAFLTNRENSDPFIKDLREHGDVVLFKPVGTIPQPNLAKVIRHILATAYRDERCQIHDIDFLPLQTEYINNLLKTTSGSTLVTTGKELYKGAEEGKFQISYMTANGSVFKDIVNPENMFYADLIDSWIGLKIFDDKEDIFNRIHHENPNCFSDESLFRALLSENPHVSLHCNRGFTSEQCLDRANWALDETKLKSGQYVEAHLPRPYNANSERIQPLLNYIYEMACNPI